MERKPLIAGNWKMNKTIGEAISYVNYDIRAYLMTINGFLPGTVADRPPEAVSCCVQQQDQR